MNLTIDDITLPITEWAADYGIPVSLIRSRLRRGWGEERAITEPMVVRRGEKLEADAMIDQPPKSRPVTPAPAFGFLPTQRRPVQDAYRSPLRRRPARLYTHNGQAHSIADWAMRLGISQQAMHYRIKTKSLEEAFKPPRAGWLRR